MTKFEKSPLGLFCDRVPAARLAQSRGDSLKTNSAIFGYKCIVAFGPHDKYHRAKCQLSFAQNWLLVIANAPFLRKYILIKRARRTPNVNALVTAEHRLRAFERSHREKVHLDVTAFFGFQKLTHSPLQPALFFCAVSNSYFGYSGVYAGQWRTRIRCSSRLLAR